MARTPSKKLPTPVLHYMVAIADLQAHLFEVTLTVPAPAAVQRLSLPVWIPGSYLVREFSRNLQQMTARQGRTQVTLRQLDKNTWEADAQPGKALVLHYRVYAFDNSVRSAWLDAERGFFNGTSLCLRVHGQEDQPHQLELLPHRATAHWQVATGLAPLKTNAAGFGNYRAPDYDALVDCPVEMGAFWSGEFKACGVPHRLVVAGAAPSFDGARLLADTQTICEAEIRFWHGSKKPPHANYVFLLNVVDDGYGGLEHRNSTALICGRRDLPRLNEAKRPEGYGTLLGLISHEYFHTWNVKRLRPVDFARYHYDTEQYTRLLWFFEGFTSYYDDLLLRRAGLLDNAGYLKLLNKTINQVQQTPGRSVQSVAQASMDAWIKYYRPDENTPNATVSYYAKGALVALCFDLTLRCESRGTLDAVMRGLWQRCKAGPMAESDFAAELEAVSGRSFAPEIAAWVRGTGELPLKDLLRSHGVAVHDDVPQLAQRLGLRVTENAGVQIKMVMRGGAAEQAGFAAGDEWLGIELPQAKSTAKTPQGWRLAKLDELLLYAGTAQAVTALVARDKKLLRLPLRLPAAGSVTTWRLAVEDARTLDAWLALPHNAGH
jgi:predicted metalloprotease with PDZ domain